MSSTVWPLAGADCWALLCCPCSVCLPPSHPYCCAVCQHVLQDELLSTELLFRGLLTGMAPEEAVALMSALVFQVSGGVGWGWGGTTHTAHSTTQHGNQHTHRYGRGRDGVCGGGASGCVYCTKQTTSDKQEDRMLWRRQRCVHNMSLQGRWARHHCVQCRVSHWGVCCVLSSAPPAVRQPRRRSNCMRSCSAAGQGCLRGSEGYTQQGMHVPRSVSQYTSCTWSCAQLHLPNRRACVVCVPSFPCTPVLLRLFCCALHPPTKTPTGEV